jgi:hypothetical protein
MPSQRNWSPEQIDAAIMGLLLDDCFDLWAVSEVEREIGNALDVRDGIRRLRGAGLIHELDMGFVTPTRAARRASEMDCT